MGDTILVVDDESLIRWSVRERLAADGHEIIEAETAKDARSKLGEGADLVLLDVGLPDATGIQLVKEFHATDPDLPVIMMTGDDSAETAVQAMLAGAFHYITKPIKLDALALLCGQALETTRLRREVRDIRRASASEYGFDHIIGGSPAMLAAKKLMGRIATSPASTVLVTGESGTGKDLAARAIHYNSTRAEGPFVNITCSALPDALLESELFGHEKGAFTDARTQKKGLFEQGNGGTVFLDEIGEMSPVLQSKLLRFLEEKTFRRVGGAQDITVDVRVVAATNRDLREEVEAGAFREDLYYRLNVLTVELPALRERVGDIPLLVEFFTQRFCHEFNKPAQAIDRKALELLESYPWPGNVRELRNAIERAVLLSDGDELQADAFAALDRPGALDADVELPAGGIDLESLERRLVVQALERTGGNQTQAAKLLGMNRDQMRYRIEKFGLKKPGAAS